MILCNSLHAIAVQKGKLKLTNLRELEWSKLILFPGLFDAATKIELRSSIDLRSGKSMAEAKLGLCRRFRAASTGLGLVHGIPLGSDSGLGVDVGACLAVPEELRIATTGGAGLRELADAAHFHVDIDRLELVVDLDKLPRAFK